MPARALVFDFNGTLSHDEPILCEIFVELFAERGRPLSAQEYFDELAGHSDEEIVRLWLGDEYPDVEGTLRPEGYLRALSLLGDGLSGADVVAFEDTEAGVASAKAAGLRCFAVL